MNRIILFDKKRIENADTLYMYLYKSDIKLVFSSQIFGLSADEPPSSLYFLSDVLRKTTQLGVGISLLLICIYLYLEGKYFKNQSSNSQNGKVKYWQLFLLILFLFIIAS